MSGEHFETIMHVDCRTAEDRRSIEWAPPRSGFPRWADVFDDQSADRSRAWITTTPYAHDAIRIAAMAVDQQPMNGITGDHPCKRAQAVALMHAVADAVQALAYDDACDSAITNEGWDAHMDRIAQLATTNAAPDAPASEAA
ncbi:MAG TPA: hypothetical protein VFT50_11595 [Baekduia sp.]|nr:hypothetical protein [Baekduia sp.]